MILTEQELREVGETIEAQAGLDDGLLRRCGPMLRMGAFDEAVRSAFVLLEERLRKAVNEEGMTATQLANYAFSPSNGPLAKLLGTTQSEREGLRELYSGAFKLFRNPSAHGVVGYSRAEGKAIIALVNLLLSMLRSIGDGPPPDSFPENVEALLIEIEEAIGPGATSRLRMFLRKCLECGLSPTKSAKTYIPFKRHAWIKFENWPEPKSSQFAVFYIMAERTPRLQFLVSSNSSRLQGFDSEALKEDLLELGFRPYGKRRDLEVELRLRNDDHFFTGLAELVERTSDQLEEILSENT